jgi:hypothetical protein
MNFALRLIVLKAVEFVGCVALAALLFSVDERWLNGRDGPAAIIGGALVASIYFFVITGYPIVSSLAVALARPLIKPSRLTQAFIITAVALGYTGVLATIIFTTRPSILVRLVSLRRPRRTARLLVTASPIFRIVKAGRPPPQLHLMGLSIAVTGSGTQGAVGVTRHSSWPITTTQP